MSNGSNPYDIAAAPRQDGLLICFGCRARGGCRHGLTSLRQDGRTFTAELVCSDEHEGGPGVAHGGWTASVLDEIVGLACVLDQNQLTVTGEITVTYIKPVPLNRPLQIVATALQVEGRRHFAEGVLTLASTGAPLARAHGVWVRRDDQHFERHQEWLQDQTVPPAE